jgi:3-oxoacyl-[acyl-carrier-protein] synthase III
MRLAAVVAGVGGHVPSTVVTNTELSSRFETSDDWIRSRTGIVTRRRVESGQSTSDLAVAAGTAALKSAAATGDDSVDLVVLATSTPDHTCPATAPVVAHRLGLGQVPAFDVAAVCSGFVYALSVANGMIAAGTARRVLLIGADTFSTILNPADRATATVFGDGAGAVVLRAGEPGEPGAVLGFDLGSDGDLAGLIMVPAGGSRYPERASADEADRWFTMEGRAVYRHAVLRMAASARSAMAGAGWQPSDVDKFVAHQANARILATVGTELGIDHTRVYSNIAAVGNTVAASIPLALADATTAGELSPGDRVLLAAFGGGATWGAAALTWPDLAT